MQKFQQMNLAIIKIAHKFVYLRCMQVTSETITLIQYAITVNKQTQFCYY